MFYCLDLKTNQLFPMMQPLNKIFADMIEHGSATEKIMTTSDSGFYRFPEIKLHLRSSQIPSKMGARGKVYGNYLSGLLYHICVYKRIHKHLYDTEISIPCQAAILFMESGYLENYSLLSTRCGKYASRYFLCG